MYKNSVNERQFEKVQLAFEYAKDGWWEIDIPNDKITLSDRWFEILGLPYDNKRNSFSEWVNLVHPDDIALTMMSFNNCLSGEIEQFNAVYRMPHKDGHYVSMYCRGRISERDSEGSPVKILGLTSDVTTLSQLNSQILESKKELENRVLLEDTLNEISVGFININHRDIDAGIEESLAKVGNILTVDRIYIYLIAKSGEAMSNTHEWCNEGVESEKHNFTNTPLEAVTWWMEQLSLDKSIVCDRVSDLPDDAAIVKEALISQRIQSVIAVPMFRGKILMGFIGFDAVKQERKWKSIDELVLRSLAVTYANALIYKETTTELENFNFDLQSKLNQQVAELQRKDDIFVKHEQELASLWYAVHNSANGILITDPDRKIIYYNKAFSQFSGYNDQELIGKTPTAISSALTNRKLYEDLNIALSSGKTWKGAFINQRKDGQNYIEENVITPIYNYLGELVNYISIKQDVTKEMNLESELQRDKQLRALGTLAGGIAHDFNNILQIIQSYAEIIAFDNSKESNIDEYVNNILHASLKGKKLVRNILTFSRQENLPLENTDISNLTRKTIKLVNPIYSNKITFRLNIEECGFVPLNELQFQQLLINLIDNAKDAVFENNEVTISLRRRLVKWDGSNLPKNVIELVVNDNGIGMSKQTVERVFEPFFTSKGVGKGTGLGLPMVKGIVDNHSAKIFINSKPGVGTKIIVHFPCLKELMT